MENILIVLVSLLVIMILILIGVTVFSKKKNLNNEVNENIDSFDKDLDIKEEVKEDNFENIKLEEPVIELDNDFEKTREQTEVIEIISSMQENAKNLTDKVADYEDEQEENAIISYTELLNAVKAKKEVQEELNLDIKEEVKEEVKPYDGQKKFHSSEAISPLGRINNVNNDSYKSDVKVTNMQSDEFLKSLKDFRGNL